MTLNRTVQIFYLQNMSPLVYLFLLLLLNKCSGSFVNVSSLQILFATFSYTGEESVKTEYLPTDYAAIQIIIFVATLLLLVIISLILCKICSRQYRTNSDGISQVASVSSMDRLVRERLQDCPPSYHESQRNLAALPSTDPPPYNEVIRNSDICSVYTITKLDDLINGSLYLVSDDASLNSAPPEYAISEGVVNPVYETLDPAEIPNIYENRTNNNELMIAENHI